MNIFKRADSPVGMNFFNRAAVTPTAEPDEEVSEEAAVPNRPQFNTYLSVNDQSVSDALKGQIPNINYVMPDAFKGLPNKS